MRVCPALAEGQNVGNFLTDRPSSRVLAAPGGASQIIFGDGAPAAAKVAPAAAKAAPAVAKVAPALPDTSQVRDARKGMSAEDGISKRMSSYALEDSHLKTLS